MANIPCFFCRAEYSIVKNGRDRYGQQRYKCQNCKRTFTADTIRNLVSTIQKRIVLHLILAGCEVEAIAEKLTINKRIIKGWKNKYLKEIKGILPVLPLLSINTLHEIYENIEKRHIAPTQSLKRRMGSRKGYWKK